MGAIEIKGLKDGHCKSTRRDRPSNGKITQTDGQIANIMTRTDGQYLEMCLEVCREREQSSSRECDSRYRAFH